METINNDQKLSQEKKLLSSIHQFHKNYSFLFHYLYLAILLIGIFIIGIYLFQISFFPIFDNLTSFLSLSLVFFALSFFITASILIVLLLPGAIFKDAFKSKDLFPKLLAIFILIGLLYSFHPILFIKEFTIFAISLCLICFVGLVNYLYYSQNSDLLIKTLIIVSIFLIIVVLFYDVISKKIARFAKIGNYNSTLLIKDSFCKGEIKNNFTNCEINATVLWNLGKYTLIKTINDGNSSSKNKLIKLPTNAIAMEIYLPLQLKNKQNKKDSNVSKRGNKKETSPSRL